MSAVIATGGAITALVVVLLGAALGGVGHQAGLAQASGPMPSTFALADVPARYLTLYQQAAAGCPGLPWTVLAGIGKVETDHGRGPQRSPAGAVGPMQFLPATFHAYAQPVPPGGVSPPTPWDPADAIFAAARMLCANGARDGRDLPAAVFAYNHASWYVARVLRVAADYATTAASVGGGSGAARTAVDFAAAQLGLPYAWGAEAPGRAFDCSGLAQAAYAAAGIHLPRVAQDQYDTGPHLPAGAPLLPGDLVFFGRPHTVHHVGIAIGDGRMINAPHRGAVIRIEPIRYRGDDYLGATRPSLLRR